MKINNPFLLFFAFFFLLFAFGFAGAVDNGGNDLYLLGAVVSILMFGLLTYLSGTKRRGKELASAYLKSESSGWEYKPELTGVKRCDLEIGDIVLDVPRFYDAIVLEVAEILKDDDEIRFKVLCGSKGWYAVNEDETISFSLCRGLDFYTLKDK